MYSMVNIVHRYDFGVKGDPLFNQVDFIREIQEQTLSENESRRQFYTHKYTFKKGARFYLNKFFLITRADLAVIKKAFIPIA